MARQKQRTGNLMVQAALTVIVVAILVSAFLTLGRQKTGLERKVFHRAKANQIAASGVHAALAILRRNSSFRGPLGGMIDNTRYEVEVADGGLMDDDTTPWAREDRYLRVTSRCRYGGVPGIVEAVVSCRSLFTEYAFLDLSKERVPWPAPMGQPDMRSTTQPWTPRRMIEWARPGATNPDAPASINRFENFGYRRSQALAPGLVLLHGGPVYMRSWLPLHDMIFPKGLHTGSHIIVQPESVGKPGIDVDGDGYVDAGHRIGSSDAVARLDPKDPYRTADSLGVRYPGGNPRILDADSPLGGGRLELPHIDFDHYRRLARKKGIYVAPDGRVQMAWKGEGKPSRAHAKAFRPRLVDLFSNSVVLPGKGAWSGGRWAQGRLKGLFVDLGENEPEAAADKARSAFHAANLPDKALLFSDCNLMLKGRFGKDCTIVTTCNILIVGDVNCPDDFASLDDLKAYPQKSGRHSVAIITPFDLRWSRDPSWTIKASKPALGAVVADGAWSCFSTHQREGSYYRHGAGSPVSRNPEDPLHCLSHGLADDFDLACVLIRSAGFFFDGCWQDQLRSHPADSAVTCPARQVFGAEAAKVHGGLVPPFPRYDINIIGSYATNWGPFALGIQDPTLVGKLRVVYDPRLRDHPPPHLPASVNIIRWRRL